MASIRPNWDSPPTWRRTASRLVFLRSLPERCRSLGGYFNEYDVSDRYEGKANLSKLAGKHTLKFGGMYGMGKYTTNLANNSAGAYSSSTAFTQGPNPLVSSTTSGFGYASFLLGTMASGTHNVTELHGHYSQPYFGFYFQDDYKMTSRFTLNLGLRWEYEAPRVEENNQVANFDFNGTATLPNGTPVRGGLAFPGVGGLPEGNWNANKKNFAPRIGFAYSLGDSMVFRGGYGIFYSNSWGNGRNNNALPQTGFICSTPVATSLDNDLTALRVAFESISDRFLQCDRQLGGLVDEPRSIAVCT